MNRYRSRAALDGRLKFNRRRMGYTLVVAGLAGVTVGLVGCGGGSGSSTTASRGAGAGRLAVVVKWPVSSTRLIPAAAQSIRVVLSNGTASLGSQLLVRPSQAPWTTTVTFDNLQAGSVTLAATAFPNNDGSGTAQATGSAPATITSGQQASVTLTMATTIKRLSVTPATPSIVQGANATLTATTYDDANSVVLVAPGNIHWTPTSNGTATVSPATGQTTTATGLVLGTQTVTATETESGVSGSATVTVAASGGCSSGTVTGPGFLAKSVWPKFGGASLGNSGKSTGSGATGVLKWSTQIGQGGSAQATLGPDGTLYIESYYDNKFYAIDSTTGTVKWSYTADSGGNTTPAVSTNGIVYFGSSFYFYALDAATGGLKWKSRADVSNSPTIGLDGTVYASGAGGGVAYDPLTGKVLWSNAKGAAGYTFVAPPLAADGSRYGISVVTGGALLSATDGKCGASAWTVPLNANAMSLGSDGTIYTTADYTFSTTTRVVAVNPADGSIKWSAPNVPVQPTPPAIDDARGVLYVLGAQGLLTALSLTDGSVKWTYQVPAASISGITSNASPSIGGDGTIYFVAATKFQGEGALFAIDPATGKSKWTYPLTGVTKADSATPTIGPDGTIYFFDRGAGVVYAIK